MYNQHNIIHHDYLFDVGSAVSTDSAEISTYLLNMTYNAIVIVIVIVIANVIVAVIVIVIVIVIVFAIVIV